MTQDHFSSLAILNIEKDISNNIYPNDIFTQKIIDVWNYKWKQINVFKMSKFSFSLLGFFLFSYC